MCSSFTPTLGSVGEGCLYHRAKMLIHCRRNISHVGGGVSWNLTALRRFQFDMIAIQWVSSRGFEERGLAVPIGHPGGINQ